MADRLRQIRDRLQIPHFSYLASSILRSGTHLLELINDVLELSKIEAGATTIETELTHLPTLFNTVESVIRASAIAKQLTFKTDYATGLPAVIQIDQRKLRQILINLLSNAVKFTHQGDVTLQVRAIHDQLFCQITDTGVGIASDEPAQLFQPFFQAEAGQHSHKGTGVGLSICQRFVQRMNGNLAVQSAIGTGTTFTVTLPFERREALQIEKAPETT